MEPWHAYGLYNAFKLHFETDGYDAFKYNFKTAARPQAFFKRKDRFFFGKLAKKYPDREKLLNFLTANFANSANGTIWSGFLVDPQADQCYIDWQKKMDSITYFYTEEVKKLEAECRINKLSFEELFSCKAGEYPRVVTFFGEGKIALETLVLLDIMLNFMKDAKVSETIFWPGFSRHVKKYRPFLQKLDINKLREITLKLFTSARN